MTVSEKRTGGQRTCPQLAPCRERLHCKGLRDNHSGAKVGVLNYFNG